MRKLVMLSLAGVAMLVAACNTVEGAGKDISSAGRAVTHTAQDAKK
jgi:predicted small secreted protein